SVEGVWIYGQGTNANTVQYDYIGTDATGKFAVSNQYDGVAVGGGAAWNNVINDVISANGRNGGLLTDAGTGYTSVNYDWIGLDATGNHAVLNINNGGFYSNINGVLITNGAYYNSASSDVISGNLEGVKLSAGATANWINNDLIGTNIPGTA